jgi:O-antigen/teichoic acid export membrane protein
MRNVQAGGWRGLLALAWAASQVFGSRIAAQAAGMAVTVIVARQLGPALFGTYAFATVAALVLAQLPGVGLDMSAVRLSAAARADAPQRARGVLLAAGGVKLLAGLLLIVAIWATTLLSPALAPISAEFVLPLRYAVVAALALALTEFAVAALQAHECFGQIFASSMLGAALKLVPVLALAVLGGLSIGGALWAFVAAALAGAAITILLAWRTWRGPWVLERGSLVALFRYARWMIAATLLGVLTGNLDVLLLAHIAGPATMGVYSSAKSLAAPLSLLGVAVGTVLLPRLSRLPAEEAGAYVRAFALRLTLALTLLGGVAASIAPMAIHLVFGSAYAAAVVPFQLLAAAFLFQVAAWPAVTVLMALDRPQVIAAVSLGMLLFVAAGYALVLPRYGSLGAALVYLLGCAACLPIYGYLAGWASRQEAVPHQAAPAPTIEGVQA